jgi:hypothetical protein
VAPHTRKKLSLFVGGVVLYAGGGMVVGGLARQPALLSASERYASGGGGSGEATPCVQTSRSALRISSRANAFPPVHLTLEEIRALPDTVFTCNCPWQGSEHTYEGTPLLPLLERLEGWQGAIGVEFRADNGYRVGVRREDLERFLYLLAYEMDGSPMSEQPYLSDRGDLITAVLFPPGAVVDPEIYKFQVVWQLSEIVVY